MSWAILLLWICGPRWSQASESLRWAPVLRAAAASRLPSRAHDATLSGLDISPLELDALERVGVTDFDGLSYFLESGAETPMARDRLVSLEHALRQTQPLVRRLEERGLTPSDASLRNATELLRALPGLDAGRFFDQAALRDRIDYLQVQQSKESVEKLLSAERYGEAAFVIDVVRKSGRSHQTLLDPVIEACAPRAIEHFQRRLQVTPPTPRSGERLPEMDAVDFWTRLWREVQKRRAGAAKS